MTVGTVGAKIRALTRINITSEVRYWRYSAQKVWAEHVRSAGVARKGSSNTIVA
jgi:hypothetical protein